MPGRWVAGMMCRMEDSALLQALRSRYDIVEETIHAGDYALRMAHPRSADALLNEEDFAIDERIPYWAEIWISARVLADRIAREPGQSRRALELGCGAGLVTVAAAAAGFEVLATDYYPEALQFVEVNARLNSLPAPLTRVLDWRRWPDDLGTFDMVLAADVLYEPAYCELVAAGIARALAPDGVAWVTDPERGRAETFPAHCRRAGLQVQLDRVPAMHEGRQQHVSFYRLRHEEPRVER